MQRLVRVFVASIAAAAFSAAAHAQTIIYVNRAAPAGGDGSSWSSAQRFLRSALEQARGIASVSNPVEIWVAQGTQRPDEFALVPFGGGQRHFSFDVPRYVTLRGHFRGIETFAADRDYQGPPTILSGDLEENDSALPESRLDNSYTLVRIEAGAYAVIDGFVIERAVQREGEGERATAINAKRADLTVRNCVIRYNDNTSFFGTTVHFESDLIENRASFENCLFHHNTANVGSAVNAVLSDVTLINCTIADNTATTTATGPSWYFGAALTRFNGNFTAINSIIWNNTSGNAQTNLACTWTRSCVLQPVATFCGTFPRFSDPLFVNPAAGDYRLQPASPAIDAGETFFMPADLNIDLDGNDRTFNIPGSTPCSGGNCVDAGVYEFGAPPLLSSFECFWAAGPTLFSDAPSWIANQIPGLYDHAIFDNLAVRVYAARLQRDTTIGAATMRGGTLTLNLIDGSLNLRPQTGRLVVSDPRGIEAGLRLRTTPQTPSTPTRTLQTQDAIIAETPGSIGRIELSDPQTRLTTTHSLCIGAADEAELIVTDGATLFASGDLIIGKTAGSTGLLSVEGADSSASFFGNRFIVGDQGVGTLSITGGASVDVEAGECEIGLSSTAAGSSLNIDLDSLFDLNGFLVVGRGGASSIVMTPGGVLGATSGLYVAPHGSLAGGGRIEADVDNFGQIAIGDVGADKLTLGAPTIGGLSIEGDYRQIGPSDEAGAEESGRLIIDVTDFSFSDLLNVTGDVELGGLLQVRFLEGSSPSNGDTYQPIQAANINGRFDVAFFPRFSDSAADSRFMRLAYPSASESGIGFSIVVDSLTSLPDLSSTQDNLIDARPTAAAIGDLDSDADLDLAIAIPGKTPEEAGQIVILFNPQTKGATFDGFELGSAVIPVGREPTAVVIADLDDAPGNDLAVTNAGDDNVQIFANTNGQGLSFPLAATIPVGDQPADLDAVDIDGDADTDLLATNRGSGTVTIIGNDRSLANLITSFSVRGNIAAGDEPVDCDPVDLDNDKDIDIVTADFGAGVVNLSVNDGNGDFTQQSTLPVGQGPVRVKAVPLDDDQFADIVTLDQLGNTVSILRSTGSLAYAPSVQLQDIGETPSSITAIDLDVDDDFDLAVIVDDPNDEMSDKVVRILRNDSIPGQPIALTQPVTVPSGASPVLLLTGDVDESGADDLITISDSTAAALLGDESQSDVVVNINNITPPTPPACPGDINDDAIVNGPDLSVLLAQFGTVVAPGQGADLNADSIIDGRDLSVLLANFGNAC